MFSFQRRFIFACYGFITYIERIFLPLNLSAFYPYPEKSGESIPVFYYLYLFIFTALTGLVLYTLKFTRKIFFAIGFFAVTICLVLQLLPVGGAIMADRYSYIPSIGIFYLMALGLIYLHEKLLGKTVPLILLVIMTLWYGVATFHQVQIWKDGITFWTDMINKSKIVAFAYTHRGNAKVELADYSGVFQDYNKAIEINPKYAEAYYNRGVLKDKLADYSGALQDYNKAIEISPKHAKAYSNRGVLKGRLKDYSRALQDFNNAIEISPMNENYYYNRGISKDKLADYTGALQDFNKAIEISPKYADAYCKRGNAKIFIGDKIGGCSDLNKAAQLGYDLAFGLINKYCH